MSLIGVVAWSGFAHPSDANGAVLTFETENFFDGVVSSQYSTTGPPIVAGGGSHSAVITAQPDGSTFFTLTHEAVVGTPLVTDPSLPGLIRPAGFEVLDSDGQAVLSEISGFGFFYPTIGGVPQTMSNPSGSPAIQFAPHPTAPTIQTLVYSFTGGGPGLIHAINFRTDALLDGMGFLGSTAGSPAAGAFGTDVGFFDLVGLTSVKNDIDGITVGFAYAPVPEPSSSVLLVSAFGFLLARRRR